MADRSRPEPEGGEASERARRRIVRWHGVRTSREDITHNPTDIRPGDTIVIPTVHPGSPIDLGDLPGAASDCPATLDVGDASYRVARAKPILRLHPALVGAWPDTLTARTTAQSLLTEMDRSYEEDADPEYRAAKSGDAVAAATLVRTLVDETGIAGVRSLIDTTCGGSVPVLVSAHAYERDGFNAIPAALAKLLSTRLHVPYDTTVVQTNVVGHTGADGYGRLARQAAFGGNVERGLRYVMVDDLVGQGGTLANLRGWVEKHGGRVVGAVGLTGKAYSAKLNPSEERLHELRERHGPDLEKWWKEHFGHPFDCLTHSEARYLAHSPDVDTIRDRLAAAVREGGGPVHARSPREQRLHVRKLKGLLDERFPQGQPQMRRRPSPGRWQGYGRPRKAVAHSAPGSIFDPRIVVIGISGPRPALPATLRLTAALRGLLMRECPEQPPSEWISGHQQDGEPTAAPHLALAPLPFVGSPHADGRILGLALMLPRGLENAAGRCLEPVLRDTETGLPQERRLFDGEWFECVVELETRERPPLNLRSDTWTSASAVWASVTPVVLNRHFKGKDKWGQAAESVKDACEHVGLPRPREVLLHAVSRVEGVPHAREFPQLIRRRDGGRQSHSHAVLVFNEPVVGPMPVV